MRDENTFRGEPCHDILVKNTTPRLTFNKSVNYDTWKNELRQKFYELTGLYEIEANASPDANLKIEHEIEKDGYREIRFTFESEIGTTVPCYLLIPCTGLSKYPVAITLQGHSTGFHNSVGYTKFESDHSYQPRGQFGIQAVQNGFAALCIEQRGMGERRPTEPSRDAHLCQFTAFRALQLGRTVLGERMFDVSRAIDVLSAFHECDTSKILITGNSGGGTTSFYSAAYDERIKLCVPSCAFCSYEASIMDMFHCSCNYIPCAYQFFEMHDIAALIAPRPLTVIAGKEDSIFPIDGVRSSFEVAKNIYGMQGAEAYCRLVETPREHWWCVDIVWETINSQVKELGWR